MIDMGMAGTNHAMRRVGAVNAAATLASSCEADARSQSAAYQTDEKP